MTNKQLMTDISELKISISEQTTLCSNIFSLAQSPPNDIKKLVQLISNNIKDLKNLQTLLHNRNISKFVEYQNKSYSIFNLIKIKEHINLEKKLKTILLDNKSDNIEYSKISLNAYSDVKLYKTQLNEIFIILDKFNNEIF